MGLLALALFVAYGSFISTAGRAVRAEPLPGLSLPDLAQNVLLYIPFGTLGVWAFRRRWAVEPMLQMRVIAIASVYSIAMELLQTLSPSRIASPLDVVANVAGAALGTMSARRAEQAWATALKTLRSTGLLTARARYILAAAVAIIAFIAWYPFDVTLDVSTLSERTRAVRRDPWLWPGAANLSAHGARFFVLAALTTSCLPGLGRWAAPAAALGVAAAALIVDLGQLAMGSHPIGVSAFVSQLAGACAGAGAAFVIGLARRTWYTAA